MHQAGLHIQLDFELPEEIAVGGGTALFVCGSCFSPEARISSLEFVVGGVPQPVMAHGLPRLEVFRSLHAKLDPFATRGISEDPSSSADPFLRSYRSGFWGIVRIAPQGAARELELLLRAELESGRTVIAEIARVRLEEAPSPASTNWPGASAEPSVAVCMATYNPPIDLFERQVDSIRSQTHRNWVCFVSDDCSNPEAYAAIRRVIGGDARFVVSRSALRRGFYRNFERALAMAPSDAAYVALADQDDAWRPEKVVSLIEAIGGAQLVYSDARIITRGGELLSDTWWTRRHNNHSSLLSLLVANAVTGAASLLRREVLDYALPFPPAQFAHFHDHWIALVALSLGDITFIDRPLYDYVQHGGASLGHAAANQMPTLRERLRQRGLRERVRMWRLHYFVDVCRLAQFATILSLRCSDRMTGSKRRTVERFIYTDRSLASLARLATRGARELVGTPETLGAEWMLFHAFAWRRMLALSARDRPQRRLRLDAMPPTSLIQQPGHGGLHNSARILGDKIAPLRWAISEDAPRRVNLLIPTIDLRHFFGGYIAKLNLARRLMEHGRRIRLVTVDPVGPMPADWRRTVEAYSGLSGLFDELEVTFGRESPRIELSRSDTFIATTWWTAHVARQALELVASDRFVYLIQEYEPFTFVMGSYAALAAQSYRFPHFGLFSSQLLRDYFRTHGIGVYAAGAAVGDAASASFENAITPVDSPSPDELARRRTRRLLFYARPEPHAARNMFELGVLALARAIEAEVFQSGWELRGIGTVENARRISLGGGASVDLVPKVEQREYASFLREHDVGLALMYTPHPSLVPIEMAAAGMLTVTSSFDNKTPESMTAISPNLITAEPTVEGIVAALCRAAVASADVERRVLGSKVRWSTNWDDSFNDELLTRVLSVLR